MTKLIVVEGFNPAGKQIDQFTPRLTGAFKEMIFSKNSVPTGDSGVAMIEIAHAKQIDPKWATERPVMVGVGTLPEGWPEVRVLSKDGPDYYRAIFDYLTLDDNEEEAGDEPAMEPRE